jgi:hypothetical protein
MDLNKTLYDEIEEERREIREKIDSLSEFLRKNRKEILKMKMGLELYSILAHRVFLLVTYLYALESETTTLNLEHTDDYFKDVEED